jgi:hypothetical protein
MKPDWRDVPSWVNYMAMHRDNNWSLFEFEPSFLHVSGRWTSGMRGRVEHLGGEDGWLDTLEERP